MNDNEKLVDLITDVLDFVDWDSVEELADYLIENGVVVPPVKVGQKVWEINIVNAIVEQEVLGVEVEQYVEDYGVSNAILLRVGYRHNGGFTLGYFYSDDIGTKLFLSKEEAEEALEKMKEAE